MPLIICQEWSFANIFQKMFLKNFSKFQRKPTVLESLFIAKVVKFLRGPSFYRTPPVAASGLSFVQIPKFQGPYSSVSTMFVSSRHSSCFI